MDWKINIFTDFFHRNFRSDIEIEVSYFFLQNIRKISMKFSINIDFREKYSSKW